jgi:prevent-host-death family protein
MAAGKFKDQCLKVLDRVAASRSPVVVTKRGRPIATLMPFTAPSESGSSLAGSVLKESADPFSTGERWHADRS